MSWAILEITDGTKAGTINLLGTGGGFLLADWRPAIQIPKSGGIWNGSPLTDGRRLALRNYENAIEVFNLTASRGSQDEIIRSMQNLFRLLDKAVNYWVTDWQTCPVWIEAKATNESNLRYALIMDYRVAGLNNPYGQPFFACPSIEDELTLTIERDYWTEQPPGTATAIEISTQQAYNGITYGRSATTEDEVFIANKHAMANITDVWYYDASAGTYHGNLVGGGLPFAMLPAVPATGDRIYFGCSTAVANNGPFSGLVFDIVVAAANITNLAWTYRSGGVWSPLAFGSAGQFTDTVSTPSVFHSGVSYVTWGTLINGDWQTYDPDGAGLMPTGYWACCEITANPAATPPSQGNREIYAPVVPFVDIDAAQTPGDVVALLRGIFTSCLELTNLGGSTTYKTSILAGTRSIARGSSFTPYINLSDVQNQAGITITPGTDVAIDTSEVYAPSGRAYKWQATTDADAVRVTVQMNNTVMQQYIGKYSVYARFRGVTHGNSHVYMKTLVNFSMTGAGDGRSELYETSAQDIPDLDQYDINFGIISIPDVEASSFTIEIYGYSDNGANNISFLDLILFPIDEWACRYDASWYANDGMVDGDYLIFDSISSPKKYHSANIYDSSDYLKSFAAPNSAGPAVLQNNSDQRLWLLSFGSDLSGVFTNGANSVFRVQLSRMARYIAMRGDR